MEVQHERINGGVVSAILGTGSSEPIGLMFGGVGVPTFTINMAAADAQTLADALLRLVEAVEERP